MNSQQQDRLVLTLRQLQQDNQNLKKEVMALKKISSLQGRQLYKDDMENDYSTKIRGLVDELKWSKEKSKELDDELKRQIRVC